MTVFLSNLTSDLKSIFKNYQLALLFCFWLVLFVLVVFEFYALKSALQFVLIKKDEIVATNASSKAVRIDFENYSSIVKRIEKSSVFQPQQLEGPNPFELK